MGRGRGAEAQVPCKGSPGVQWREGQVSDSAAHVTLPRAMASILGTWLHLYPEDFNSPRISLSEDALKTCMTQHAPHSELEQQVRHLLVPLGPWSHGGRGHGGEDSGWVKRRGRIRK